MLQFKSILLVEDDAVDTMVVQRALKELGVPNKLVRATNGKEALDLLREGESELPCVLLLDLNMPKMNGIELLEILRADEVFRDIPVFFVSMSTDPDNMAKSAELGAVSYIVKCDNYREFRNRMEAVRAYVADDQRVIDPESTPAVKGEVSLKESSR